MKTLYDLSREEVIDTRDLQERINDLESLGLDDLTDAEDYDFEDDIEELETLREIEKEVGDSAFEYGETMIRQSYIKEYLQEMARDCGDLPKDLPWWIESNINWDGVCDDLLMDYSEVDILGITFYYRC